MKNNTKNLKQEVANAWNESPTKAVGIAQSKLGDDLVESVYQNDYSFYDEVTHLLKAELVEEVQKIDNGHIEPVNINNISALNNKLDEIRRHPEYLLYDVNGGVERTRPIELSDFQDIIDDVMGQ